MASLDAEVDQALLNLELVTTSKRLAEPFEEAYQWLIQSDTFLHPKETVGTLAFASKGRRKVGHLTWEEITSLHEAFERLNAIEDYLKARQVDRHLVSRTGVHEPE